MFLNLNIDYAFVYEIKIKDSVETETINMESAESENLSKKERWLATFLDNIKKRGLELEYVIS